MNQTLYRRKLWLLVLIVSFTSSCIGSISRQANSEPQISNPQSGAGRTIEPTVNAPAVIVHIDPNTGEFVTPSSGALPGQLPQPQTGTAKAPSSELLETLSPVSGGGVVIQLDERFNTPLTSTIDADGKLRLDHQSTMSDSDKKK